MVRKDTRLLHVFGQEWEYKIGRNTVAIYDSEGNRYFPTFSDICGERNVEKGNFTLNPQMIKNHIEVVILKSTPTARKCQCCNTVKMDVRMRCNPFNVEIYGNYDKHLYCDDCISDLADEI
jgi:hypothetical protein